MYCQQARGESSRCSLVSRFGDHLNGLIFMTQRSFLKGNLQIQTASVELGKCIFLLVTFERDKVCFVFRGEIT